MKFDEFVINRETDPYYNLACEEVLLDSSLNIISIWRNEPSVIVGRHQNTYKEVNQEYTKNERIPVVRRLTGGGAVYHDLGNVNISFFFNCEDFEGQVQECLERIIDFLRINGIDAQLSGRNDICTNYMQKERKLSGCAMMQRGQRGLLHATLLFDTDVKKMENVLTPEVSKLRANGTDSVRARVINISELTDAFDNADSFMDNVTEYFQEGLKIREADSEKIEELAESRYRTWQWNYGRNPQAEIKAARKFEIGTVDLNLTVTRGIITECVFGGDYIDKYPLEEVAEQLMGQKFDDLKTVIEKIDCMKYFGENKETISEFILKGI